MGSGDRLTDAMNVGSNGNGRECIAPNQLPLSLFPSSLYVEYVNSRSLAFSGLLKFAWE
jgi:hypothetical protein